jgi:heptosyltransferase-2
MGNVLATTSILPAIKRKYPESEVTWITMKISAPLLMNNPLIDRVFIWEPESWMILEQEEFDVVMNVDKSRGPGSFTMRVNAKERLGFGVDRRGAIVPLNPEAEENYMLGLDDELKFRRNVKTVPQLECEEFKLPYERDQYILNLTADEIRYAESYKREHGILPGRRVIGFNTGCSELYPNKKMTVDQHEIIIRSLLDLPDISIVLLGGPEDTLRNAELARRLEGHVVSTPTTDGVRRGACYESLCDIVVTGDSFGMHLAIALKKYVIAWFGLSSATEIDLFDRGVKLVPEGLACSPCWKKQCPHNLECVSMIDLDRIRTEIVSGLARLSEHNGGVPA